MPLLDYKPVPEHVVVIKPVSLLGPVTVSEKGGGIFPLLNFAKAPASRLGCMVQSALVMNSIKRRGEIPLVP